MAPWTVSVVRALPVPVNRQSRPNRAAHHAAVCIAEALGVRPMPASSHEMDAGFAQDAADKNILLSKGSSVAAHRRFPLNAGPPRSCAGFFAALRSRESKQCRHILQSREEAEQHREPAKHWLDKSSCFSICRSRTSTSLKPSFADCVAAGAAVEAARLTAGTMF